MPDCRGGCGAQVPDGMKCVPCATRAVDEWLERRARRPIEDVSRFVYVHTCGYRRERKGHRRRDVIYSCHYCQQPLEPPVTVS